MADGATAGRGTNDTRAIATTAAIGDAVAVAVRAARTRSGSLARLVMRDQRSLWSNVRPASGCDVPLRQTNRTTLSPTHDAETSRNRGERAIGMRREIPIAQADARHATCISQSQTSTVASRRLTAPPLLDACSSPSMAIFRAGLTGRSRNTTQYASRSTHHASRIKTRPRTIRWRGLGVFVAWT
jgi:hypothetical protein